MGIWRDVSLRGLCDWHFRHTHHILTPSRTTVRCSAGGLRRIPPPGRLVTCDFARMSVPPLSRSSYGATESRCSRGSTLRPRTSTAARCRAHPRPSRTILGRPHERSSLRSNSSPGRTPTRATSVPRTLEPALTASNRPVAPPLSILTCFYSRRCSPNSEGRRLFSCTGETPTVPSPFLYRNGNRQEAGRSN